MEEQEKRVSSFPPSFLLPLAVPGELGLGQEKSPFEEKLLGPNSRTADGPETEREVGWLGLCQQFE